MDNIICPLDDRYAEKIDTLSGYFTGQELNFTRLFVMDKWLETVLKLKGIPPLPWGFYDAGCKDDFHREICGIEATTRHDINAIIVYMSEYCGKIGRSDVLPYIHFGCTSNDVNSVAQLCTVKSGYTVLRSAIIHLRNQISTFGSDNNCEMLGHTHGQPATPPNFQNVMAVFVSRLDEELSTEIRFKTKFGGATGGLNAFYLVEPNIDWLKVCDEFVRSFGFERYKYTTQISHYDEYSRLFDHTRRLCVILLNFVKDIWLYIGKGYIVQRPVEGEVGSSTMPHKINPIQMENSEGNFHMAIMLLEGLSRELPQSRMQRDLHDSTMLRNIGMPFGYMMTAISSITDGLKRYSVNKNFIGSDLLEHWEILGEAVQSVLRWEGYAEAYNMLKTATRNNEHMGEAEYLAMIDKLPISPEIKKKLSKLTPDTYYTFSHYSSNT